MGDLCSNRIHSSRRRGLGSFSRLALGKAFALAPLIGILVTHQANAGVNVNNGNFYVAYTDLYIPTAGLTLDITRTYNSRSNYVQGYFGIGWSSEIEGYIRPDGNAFTYFEGGGGNVVRFEPKGKGQWHNGVFGPQVLTKEGSSFKIKTNAGKNIFLSQATGRIIRIEDPNGNKIELDYPKGGTRPTAIKDNFGNQITVTWKDYGRFPRITGLAATSTRAVYEYNGFGNLVKASGADGIPFIYTYDDEHNMTKISYSDGSEKEMGYNKTRDWITRFKERDKSEAKYEYLSDSIDPENKFGTVVEQKLAGSKEKMVSRFWYEFKKRADGTRYNARTVTYIQGQVTETLFTECCGTPQLISQWESAEPSSRDTKQSWTVASGEKRTTRFEYFPDGMLKKKTQPDGSFTELAYDQKSGKVSSVAQNERKIDYKYDPKGNLAWAFDNLDNRRLDLSYDLKGRITKIRDQFRIGARSQWRDVFFRYDGAGNPVEIKEKSQAGTEGTIKFSYNPGGDVVGVTNGQGRTISSEAEVLSARQVASTFQNLLEIIRPAGVQLTPEG